MKNKKTTLENGIKLISAFLAKIESTETIIEEKETALNGIHNTVKSINNRNSDYFNFMEVLGKNKGKIKDSLPESINLTKDYLRRLNIELKNLND